MNIKTEEKRVSRIEVDGAMLTVEYFLDGRVTWVRSNSTIPYTALKDAYEAIKKEIEG